MDGKGEDGFALVEAIAALAMSAIVAAGLMAALGSAGARTAEARIRNLALRQAETLMTQAMAAADLQHVPTKGEAADAALSWAVVMGARDKPYRGIQQVAVEVRWKTAGKEGVTRLEAYRLAIS